MAENFYIILGVSRDAELEQIRSAYRRLVKQYHPDVSPESSERFFEVQRTYETLRDAEAREQHDNQANVAVRVVAHAPSPRARHESRASPSRHVQHAHPEFDGQGALFGAVDEFFGGFVPGVFDTGAKSLQKKDLYVEMILTPQEANSGGIYPLQVPVTQYCSECGGTGHIGRLYCPVCRGGRLDYHEVRVSIPPGVAHGQRAQLSLEDIGLKDANLNVLVLVRPED